MAQLVRNDWLFLNIAKQINVNLSFDLFRHWYHINNEQELFKSPPPLHGKLT